MSKIKVMDEILANKIAAGEVIEKVMNIVKELVENSIDAKSTEIKIELKDSGVKEVKVSDNGIGMDRDDSIMAFSRHATSKLTNLSDLFNIESLGFRGEALPSIASVSKVKLKTSNEKVGTLVKINGGHIESVMQSDLQKGTDITVSDIFYNTPVRLKYIKNLYSELANVIDYVNKMALSYPNIKFTLTNNGKVLLTTKGDNNLYKVIYDIYGVEVAKKMVEINASNDDYEIKGYISYPELSRSNRLSITTLVNGRVIRNNDLNRTIIDSYHTYIPKTRFPIIVLNIYTDPILVDVNVHPTKMDVKFSKMDTLNTLIHNTISDKLKELTLIPDVSVRTKEQVDEVKEINNLISINSENIEEVKNLNLEEIDFDFDIKEEDTIYNNKDIINSPKEKISKPKKEIIQTTIEETLEKEYKIKDMTVQGIIYKTYIIAENEDGMYLIDQHAAAERINYEKCLSKILSPQVEKIPLLIPIRIEMTKNEFIIVKKHLDTLLELGIETEEFGDNTFIVRTHPTFIRENKEKEEISQIFEIIAQHEKFEKEKFIDHMAATMACRMSIKANDYITLQEADTLLKELRKCNNPFNCPHGRPTIITFTKYELEKMFKRVMD